MSEIPVIKAALLGAGTVGGGVLRILEWQRDEMPKKLGVSIELKKILVRDKTKKREGIDSALLTEDWQEILSDPEIQIVIEVMGGIEPARTYILEALRAGKNVVTANKDLLAEHGRELLDTAERAGRDLMFEAAVAGGIPIIRPLKQCLAANHITEVMGIVNGTTNYILTRMTAEGMEFSEALARATELGYAEADPTADIEGYDAARKVAILASIAFNSRPGDFLGCLHRGNHEDHGSGYPVRCGAGYGDQASGRGQEYGRGYRGRRLSDADSLQPPAGVGS